MEAATHLTVLRGLLVAEPGLEVGAGRVSSLAAYGRFASKEPSTERAGCGAGRRLLRIT